MKNAYAVLIFNRCDILKTQNELFINGGLAIMLRSSTNIKIVALYVAIGTVFLLSPVASAATADVSQVEDFIRNVIKIIAGLAGLVATGFFVIGGFGYITSSGNPENLDKAKRTLLWSGIGLAIVIAAFVISNIIVTIATNSFGN
jgi:hypothetical protein